jgi:septal ring factor EnvC (AmiA/AmiB activator)
MIEQFKQALEEVLSPHLEAMQGDIKDLTTQVAAQDAKIEALRRGMELARREADLMRREFLTELKRIEDKLSAELHAASTETQVVAAELRRAHDALGAEIRRIDEKFAAEIRANSAEIRRVEETLSTDFTRFEGIVDMRLIAMNEKLEFTRRELLAEMKVAEKADAAA